MNSPLEQIFDEARGAWRFRWAGLIAATVAAFAGWAVVLSLPDKYEATASVFVDTRTALKPALQGLATDQEVGGQLNYVRQSLLTGAQIEKIANQSGILSESITDPRQRAGILSGFADRVSITVRSAGAREGDTNGSIYTFAYQDGDRGRSLKIAKIIMQAFIDETLGGKREGDANAQKFLEGQIKTYELRLRDAENKLADFKKHNVGLMPTEQGGYFAQLQAEIDSSNKVENDLNVAVSRRAELNKQLHGESVLTAAGSVAPLAGSAGGDTLTRIKETQARLDELLLRFTDKHPDVVAARASLEELKKRREVELESLRRGDAGALASTGASSNPVYQSIQLQLNQADVDIASLRNQLSQHRGKAAELRQRMDIAPKVEAEYAQLTRDYDSNKTEYAAILANYEKARLGEQAGNQASVRFEVVQPPTASFQPVSPRRGLLLMGVLILGFAFGGGLAWLLNVLRPVVSSVRALQELTALPVLGVVSAAFPHELRIQAQQDRKRFVLAVAVLPLAFVILLVFSNTGARLFTLGTGAG